MMSAAVTCAGTCFGAAIVIPLHPFCLSMIFSENRCTLFRIML